MADHNREEREVLIEKAAKAMSAYEREQDRKRGDESQRIFGHRGAFIGEHHPTQKGRAEAALAVFEQAHAPTDDEREALDADVTRPRDNEWQRLWNELVSFAAVYRRERGYSPNEAARADFLTAAGFRRSEVSEPQGEHFHIWSDLPCKPGDCRMEPQGEPFSDHSERYVPKRPKEPQGEPSDAQVGAAMHAVERYYASQGFTSVADSVDYQAMRAALRAAGGHS